MGHSHDHGPPPPIAVGGRARGLLLGLLAIAAAATVAGVLLLWPDQGALHRIQSDSQYAAPGVTFPDARVDSIAPACPVTNGSPTDPTTSPSSDGASGSGAATCGTIGVTVTEGPSSGEHARVAVNADVTTSSLGVGDTVQLVRNPAGDGQPASFAYVTTERGTNLLWLALAFVVVVVTVARWRGAFAVVSLALAAVAVWRFTLPALLTGENGTWVALTSGVAIMFVVLYLTHGVSLRTSTALAGTIAGLLVTAGLGFLVIDGAHLTGVADETGSYLTAAAGTLDFGGLLSAGIVIAGLGVLNDVTVTQASAVWELRAASPDMGRGAVFGSAMRIGRDHIASTIYTLVFAYAGTGLVTLLLLQVYDRPILDLLSTEELAEEVVRTLVSAIGLVLAVPLTTGIAALVAGAAISQLPTSEGSAPSSRGGHRRARRARRWRRDPDWGLHD